jgi:Holliday junction resolvase RusA-like endonuclease
VGRGHIIDSNREKLTDWRSDIVGACLRAMPEGFQRLEGPVVARMVFSFDRPKTVKFTKRPFHVTAPDLSKLCRAAEDALTAAKVWRDDSQVCYYTALKKVYCNEDPEALEVPGVLIIVSELEAPPSIIGVK